jgi:hypothetical protein
MSNVAVVSCIFGKTFNVVYDAPHGATSFFFSNRTDLVDEVTKKAWKYIFLDFPLSDDDAVSSFQAKYVNFLQFLRERRFDWFNDFDEIVYVDHKFLLTSEHLKYIEINKKAAIFLRRTPRLKTTVWDEVDDAMGQERYRRFISQTRKYINDKLKTGYSDTVRMCNTGLISYSHKLPKVISLVNEVYSDLQNIGTTECQIIWAIVSQRYTSIIQTIEWQISQ